MKSQASPKLKLKTKLKKYALSAAAIFAAVCAITGSVFALLTINIQNTGNIIKSAQSPIRLEVSENADMSNARSLNVPYPALFVATDALVSGASVAKYISVESAASGIYYQINLSARGVPLKSVIFSLTAVSGGGNVLAGEIVGERINYTSSHMYGYIGDGQNNVFLVMFSLRDSFSLPPGSELTVDIRLESQDSLPDFKYIDSGLVYKNDAAATELFMASSIYASGESLFTVFGFSAQWSAGNRPAVLKKTGVSGNDEGSVLLADTTTYGINSRICYLYRKKRLLALAGTPKKNAGSYVQIMTILTSGTLSREVWSISSPLPQAVSASALYALTSASGMNRDYVYALYAGADAASCAVVRFFDDGSRDNTFGGTKGYISAADFQDIHLLSGAAAQGEMLYISAQRVDGQQVLITMDTQTGQADISATSFAGALAWADGYLVLTATGRAELLNTDGSIVPSAFEQKVFAGRNIAAAYHADNSIYFLTAEGDIYRAVAR